MSIEDRFTPAAAVLARDAIADAGGNEVFLLGTLDEDDRVAGVRVLARGNRHAVPALLQIARPGEVVIHNHPSGQLQPSGADLEISSALGQNGVGSYLIDNTVSAVYAIVEPHRPKQAATLGDETTELLAPGGGVAARLDGYEHRPEQLRMLTAVSRSFNEDAILTVEAGTGTGKSLAYLLPAIQWSLQNQERVVVSTRTINLQEQLINKDLPFLVEKAGLKCTTALVKGRGNYLCQRKAAQIEAQGEALIEDDLRRELNEILAWAKKTKDGSLSDLSVRPRTEVWEQVISENDNCLRARCPHYNTCFFYSARRAAAKADIVVANHHLLMADLSLRRELASYSQNAVLPPAKRVIIDEAHHLEDVATNYFGARISLYSLERWFGRLRSQRYAEKGLLPGLMLALESVDHPDLRIPAHGAARHIEERILPRRGDLLTEAEKTFLDLTFAFQSMLGREIGANATEKVRVVPALRASELWNRTENALQRLAVALGDFANELGRVVERIATIAEEGPAQVLYLSTELDSLAGRIATFAAGLEQFIGEDEENCRWFELRNRPRTGTSLAFNTAPIRVGPLLRQALFEPFKTAVMTSATLAVDRRFDYLHERVGLHELEKRERVATLHIDSPFDYQEQALLAVPRDLPEPNAREFEPRLQQALREILQATQGGTFVLFTAYGLLNRAVQQLQPELQAQGFTVLQQGQTNRQLLLERFVKSPKAVLFATDSFWEGVDVRGDALRCVVITRLPFKVPTEPIEQARVEDLEARGGDPFMDHALPQAVIKLKQGFGRLIRSRSDRGAVVLLDSRVVRKHYGRVFLDSLPPARRLIANQHNVWSELRQFFGR